MENLEKTLAGRLDPSPESDAGHYVELPVFRGEHTLEVPDGQSVSKVYVLGPEKSGSDTIQTSGTLPFSNIVLGASAKADIVIIVLPGADIDVPVAVDLVGSGANINISGLYLCGGKDKVSICAEIRHRVPECTSYQLFNGIAGGSSNVKFFGKIVVAPDAQKTEAYQTNHNLVISDNAHAETKPQLEIYADDVKCSHGATVGQLNEDEQFYMRSRGVPEQEARVLQMISFIAPVLSGIADEEYKEKLTALVENAIRAL